MGRMSNRSKPWWGKFRKGKLTVFHRELIRNAGFKCSTPFWPINPSDESTHTPFNTSVQSIRPPSVETIAFASARGRSQEPRSRVLRKNDELKFQDLPQDAVERADLVSI